uniref:Uncharacterized protein n=1 Tax=Paramoeba aestuarina TaxID=180227 RepID=A0A7S4KTV3_9EUKA|mmetsp:Transcript_25453/g.39707  ORF Transcript_25453/g.39707 Transcript_25453/m.39707 type:complete len:153 (+) Transcript_25453:395-853(+)
MQVLVTYEGLFAELVGPGELFGSCFLSIAHRDALLGSALVLLHLALTFVYMSVVSEYPPAGQMGGEEKEVEMRTVGEEITGEEEQEIDENQKDEKRGDGGDIAQREAISISHVLCGVFTDLSFLSSPKLKIALALRCLSVFCSFFFRYWMIV